MGTTPCIIKKIELYKAPLKLREPFVTSLASRDSAENIYLVIRTENGITGFGECAPSAHIQGENMDGAFAVGEHLARTLLNRDALDLVSCIRRMDAVIFGNSGIKSAFEIALYDVAAQEAGIPLYAFLEGRNDREIRTDYTVSVGPLEKMVEDALTIVKKGFTEMKVKVGKSGGMDAETIRAIREAIGPQPGIRIDANQGWEPEYALDVLRKVTDCNIRFCEEPIPRWQFMELPGLREKSPVPIMADETCYDPHDARRLAGLSACDAFNLKLGKSGIARTLEIIRVAEANGFFMQFGGMLESRLAFTAAAHLAMTSNQIRFFDFDSPLFMLEDPVLGGIEYGNGGLVKMPEGNGLGASLDEAYLSSLEGRVVE